MTAAGIPVVADRTRDGLHLGQQPQRARGPVCVQTQVISRGDWRTSFVPGPGHGDEAPRAPRIHSHGVGRSNVAMLTFSALKIAGWLSDQEQRHRVVLYVADSTPSSQWTMTCIRQADLVLVLGMGDDPALGEYGMLWSPSQADISREVALGHEVVRAQGAHPASRRPHCPAGLNASLAQGWFPAELG